MSVVLAVAAGASGCSLKRLAVNKVGDAIASGGATYETDDDLELVGDALPFSLKLLESLLGESPDHRGMLTAACKGFTSYAYAFVQNGERALGDPRRERGGQARVDRVPALGEDRRAGLGGEGMPSSDCASHVSKPNSGSGDCPTE